MAVCLWTKREPECIKAYKSIPSLLSVFVSKGQDIRGPAAAVANHHRDWRCVPEVLQYDGDDIRTSLYDESHHGDALADACKQVKE